MVVLDHHKTAHDRLALTEGCDTNISSVIDINKSSATIAYEHFSEKLAREKHIKVGEETKRYLGVSSSIPQFFGGLNS